MSSEKTPATAPVDAVVMPCRACVHFESRISTGWCNHCNEATGFLDSCDWFSCWRCQYQHVGMCCDHDGVGECKCVPLCSTITMDTDPETCGNCGRVLSESDDRRSA